MKKYLINGALALFAGAFVVGCAEKESDFVPLAEQKAKAFEEVFKELYGEPDPYQDWGFSSGKIEIDPNDSSLVVEVVDVDGDIAYTRTVPFRGMVRAGARGLSDLNLDPGANKNRNQWAAVDGKFDLLVPTPLTEGQCNRVRAYFQTHRFLEWETPNMTNYFVQQVYTGHTNTSGSLSTEQYTKGNGVAVIGSKHMDQLTVGADNVHVLDFNGADNPNIAEDVLNNGVKQNSNKFHSDQITLMVGVRPTCVGYQSSEGSVQHNDCCALVGAKVIDDWARSEVNYVNGKPIGEDVWYGKDQYGYNNSTWNRSFVGLDYEQLTLEQCLTNNNVKISHFQKDWVWDGSKLWKKSDYIATNGDDLKYNNNVVKYVTSNTNEICATNVDEAQQTWYLTRMDASQFGGNSSEEVIDLTRVKVKLDTNSYPVENGGLQKWVKNIGGRDYVFSDWIVTLSPAGVPDMDVKTYTSETDIWTQIESGRVFCEDLANASLDDLDFNDVVFDVTVWENETSKREWWERVVNGVVTDTGVSIDQGPTFNYYASITLRAAGGTIPITVNGIDVHSQFKDGGKSVAENTMINTRDNKSTAFGSYISCEPVELEGKEGNNMLVKRYRKVDNVVQENNTYYTLKMFKVDRQDDGKYIEKIPVWSSYGTAKQIQKLESVRGTVPRKFMAPTTTAWTSERKNISLAYPGFGKWVKDGTPTPWNNVNPNYTYDVDKPYSADGTKLPLVIKARKTVTTDGEEYLWSGSEKYEDSWSFKNQTARLPNNNEEKAFDKFYPGDHLRLRAKDIGDDAWMSVTIGDITPYFIDSEFPNYVKNADGSRESRTEGCVEVLLDEDACKTLNNYVSNGKITFTVQGRNFTLTGITRVLFQ